MDCLILFRSIIKHFKRVAFGLPFDPTLPICTSIVIITLCSLYGSRLLVVNTCWEKVSSFQYRSRQVCREMSVEMRGARVPLIFPNSEDSLPCVYFLVATHYRVGCMLISVHDRTIDLILVWSCSIQVFQLDILT